MTWKTHVVGGLLLSEAVCLAIGAEAGTTLATTAVSGVMALAPDLDHPNSKPSRFGLNRLIAYPLNSLFGHRGFIHSPLLWFSLSIILVLCKLPVWLCLGVFLGTLSHLILDTLNPSGIPWLYPSKRRFHLASICTNSSAEILILVLLAVPCVLLFIPILKGGARL